MIRGVLPERKGSVRMSLPEELVVPKIPRLLSSGAP